MKILVTGCAGFIGINFTKYLLENYPTDSLVGVDCLTYAANTEELAKLFLCDSFTFYKENISDAAAIDKIFSLEKPDVVINFAAESHVDRSFGDPELFFKTNVQGTEVLLGASLRHGVGRYHQISTDEVYGEMPIDSKARFTEDSPLAPTSPYSKSKAEADRLVLAYRERGLRASISRSTNNFGKFQHTEKLIPMTVSKLISGESVPIYGDGRNMRDWLFVIDHCRAVDMIIRAGKCEIYNISAENEWSNIDLVKKIMSLSGIPDGELAFVKDRPNHDRRYPVDSSKIRSLGWQPEGKFGERLRETVEWYRGRK